MGRKKAIARLKEYARRSGLELKFVVVSIGQDDKRVVMRVVINGSSDQFPDGVGENTKEAKENAARSALRILSDKENQIPVMKKKDPNVQPYRKNLRTRLFDNLPECKPTGVSCTVVTEDDASTGPPAPQTVLDSCGASSVPVVKACNSSKNPKVTQCPEEKDSLNTPSEITSAISEIVSHSGFDCVTLIGKGAFGRVYKARDKLLGKYYAIKVIPCKEKALREAEALSVLDHLNIVRYHACWMGDSGCQSDGTDSSCSSSQSSSGSSTMFLYIQLGLCDTKTLGDWINERNMEKSSPNSKRREESLNIAQQMVRGVEYIHSKKFIHRDLKPSNILFGQDGKVKIGDFSLVTTDNADDDKTPMERTLDKGTPLYMAPEQESGKTYDRKVDIFALGLIYFELLWTIPTYHERGKIWGDVRRQKLPRKFAHTFTPEYIIINLMLSVKPEERPEACEVVTELDECAHKLNIEEIVRRGRTTVTENPSSVTKMDVREELDRIVEQTDRKGFFSTLEDIVLELLGPAVETTKPENPPPQPPPSFPAGPPQPAANSLAGGFGGWTLQGAGPPIIVQQVPSMAAPFTTVPAHLNSQPVTVSQGQNLLYQWPVNSVLTEATAAAVPLAAPSNPGNSVLKIPECMTRYLRPIGVLNGMMVCDFATSPLPLNKPASKKRKRHEQEEGEDRLYVKKPPNAFMVYLEEQRPKVKAELTHSGSAAVNAVVAQRWKSLSRDQQEKYYKRAEEERILHAQKHPGWSSRDNYGKKKRTVQSSTCSTASALKSVQEAQQAKRASANVPVYGTFHLPHTKSQDLPASQASFLPHQLGSISSLTQTPALGMKAAPPSTSLAAFAGPTEPQSEAIFFGNTGEELLSHLENFPSTQPQEPFVHHSDSWTGCEISADTAVDAPPSTLVCTPAASDKPTATVFSSSVEDRLLSFLNNFPY